MVWISAPLLANRSRSYWQRLRSDRAVQVLRLRGISSALVDAGGSPCMAWFPPGQSAWRVRLRDPSIGFILKS